MYSNDLIFGKDKTENIVSIEYFPTPTNNVVIFKEIDGVVSFEMRRLPFFILSEKELPGFKLMKGDNHYKWLYETFDLAELNTLKHKHREFIYTLSDPQENLMYYNGLTYFKGMKSLQDISVLSLDLETTGLDPMNHDARILIKGVKYRNKHMTEKKMFCYDEYKSEKEFLEYIAAYINKMNPSHLTGHNIYKFDMDYLIKRAKLCGANFNIGRDKKEPIIIPWVSEFRKSQIESYDYHQIKVFGRTIVDTWFTTIRYDSFTHKYDNYKLKNIIEVEEKSGNFVKNHARTFYDGGKIRFNYKDPTEWEKIKAYCADDADDALKLYDMTIKTQFLVAPHIPKPFQKLLLSATGSQVNSLLERHYLSQGISIPKASEKLSYEGAISFGNKGIYKNTFKIDVSSLYPSIILQYGIYPEGKDVNRHFIEMVDYFTTERLKNKKLALETGDSWYKELQEVQKIFINSAYGFMGTTGLPFNYMQGAADVTKYGREIIMQTVKWAQEEKGYDIANCDTDSILVAKRDRSPFTEVEQKQLLEEINSKMPSKIVFAHDGLFDTTIIFATKNYILKRGNKIGFKGSALKAPMLEKKFKEFLNQLVDNILVGKTDQCKELYDKIAYNIQNLPSMEGFTFKTSITPKKLEIETHNVSALKVQNLIKRHDLEVQLSDKLNCFYLDNGDLEIEDKFQGEYSKVRLLEKLWKVTQRFDGILPCEEMFTKYHLKRNINYFNTVKDVSNNVNMCL